MTEIFLEILGSLIGNIHHLIIFIGCFYYLKKIRNSISVTLFIGSLIVLLTSITSRAIINYVLIDYNEPLLAISDILKLTNGAILIGSIIFSIGFIMLIIKLTKSNRNKSS